MPSKNSDIKKWYLEETGSMTIERGDRLKWIDSVESMPWILKILKIWTQGDNKKSLEISGQAAKLLITKLLTFRCVIIYILGCIILKLG